MIVNALRRHPLIVIALFIGVVQTIQFVVDPQALFFPDSGAFMVNAMGTGFVSFRSYVYGWMIRAFVLPFHSLPALVIMHLVMGGLTAWLLAFALLRYVRVRAWIALLAAVIFTIDPVQVFHERMMMAEAFAILAAALYLVTAIRFVQRLSPGWLVLIAFFGILLVSLRTVYLPVVLACAILLPVIAHWPLLSGKPRALLLALLISCGSTLLFHEGYRYLTGWLGSREPGYHYSTGYFLLANAAPLLQEKDADDAGIAAAISAQKHGNLPLTADHRSDQIWDTDGLVGKIRAIYGGDDRLADAAAHRLANAAIRRDPAGFLRLGLMNYWNYWRNLRDAHERLAWHAPHPVSLTDARRIEAVFHEDIWNQDFTLTPSGRYYISSWVWYGFLLLAPLLSLLAFALSHTNRKALALVFCWECLLLAATCFGGQDAYYRYLHPFSFTAIFSSAVLLNTLIGARSQSARR